MQLSRRVRINILRLSLDIAMIGIFLYFNQIQYESDSLVKSLLILALVTFIVFNHQLFDWQKALIERNERAGFKAQHDHTKQGLIVETEITRQRFDKETRIEVAKKTNDECFYCGKNIAGSKWQVDHLWPVSAQGLNEIINLVPACRKCNVEKGWASPFHYLFMKWMDKRQLSSYERDLLAFHIDNSPQTLTNMKLSEEYVSIVANFGRLYSEYPNPYRFKFSKRGFQEDTLDDIEVILSGAQYGKYRPYYKKRR